jgi:hypothetical protein
MLNSFQESDIEVLIFLLHNIGLQLRKSDPAALKEILTVAEQKKNSFHAELKLHEANKDEVYDQLKKREKKVSFLNMELQDIKNNKGTMTLQVKSIEHL